MAGIQAVSASKTHDDSGADVSATGFIVGERIALATDPAGTSHAWSLSAPSDSAPARSALDDDDDATPSFIPDVPGYYVVSVTLNGSTLYVLRIAVVSTATVRIGEVQHMLPIADSQVTTPQTGFAFYCGSDHSSLPCIKKSDGTVHTVDLTAV